MINLSSFKPADTRQVIIEKFGQPVFYYLILWSIAIIGVAVHLVSYIGNRSLSVDEAALSISLVTRSFAGLLEQLEYRQIAPVGFLFVEKLFIELLGENEFALRMFPIIGGVASIFLFWELSKNVLNKAIVPIALFFFITSRQLIYYSSSVKQYSTDVFFTLIILLFAVKAISEKRGWLFLFLYAAVGSLAVWFSHPAIFILGGSGMAITYYAIRKKDLKLFLYFTPAFLFWVVSFSLNYFLILNNYQSSGGAFNYWGKKHAFMPLFPSQLSDLTWLYATLKRALQHPVGLTYKIPSVMLFMAGSVMLYRTKKHYFFVFSFSILLALVASGFKAFPFSGRTILYTVPIFLIVIAAGIDLLRKNLWPANKLIFISIVFIFLLTPASIIPHYLTNPITHEEIKPALRIIEARSQSSDILYVPTISQKAFRFYRDKYNLNPDMEIALTEIPLEADSHEILLNYFKGHDRAWLLFTHCWGPLHQQFKSRVLQQLDSIGEKTFSYEKDGAWLYLYNLKQQ